MLILASEFGLHDLVHVVLFLCGLGLICWLLFWLVGYIGIPEPFNKVARAVIAVFAVIALIVLIAHYMGGGNWSW
jgi:hypothetical protein